MRFFADSRAFAALLTVTVVTVLHGPVRAQQNANDIVQGSFSQAIPIEVPAYRGLEPRLALTYSSERRNGFAGVGWGLSGFSSVVRTSGGRGVPRFDSKDVFVLDGQELVTCPPPSPSPGC